MSLRIKHLFLVLLVFIFSLSLLHLVHVYADDDTLDTPQELEDKISNYEKKISALEGKAKTLSRDIEVFDSNIYLTQLRIQDSVKKIKTKEDEIHKLGGSIEDLKIRIIKLEDSIIVQEDILGKRIRERYKMQETSPIIILFGSNTIDEIIQKTQYLKVLEIEDNHLLDEMATTKETFQTQKGLFEEEKGKKEDLKTQLEKDQRNLEANRALLVQQKSEKQQLLDVTQNDEAKYQKLLADAQKELNQITGAVSVLKNGESKSVKQGDIIGTQGSSGYSNGDHLHFGVYKYKSFADIDGWNWYYSNYVDPAKVLKSKSVYWNTGCEYAKTRTIGTGGWAWPLSSPTISQGFGHTCWSNIYYGGKDHPAYDMYGAYGSNVYAVDDGKAYTCRNCLGDGGNGVFIFHDDGYMTLYWHLR